MPIEGKQDADCIDLRARHNVDTENFSWARAAAVGIFLPMMINLLVLVMYLVTAS